MKKLFYLLILAIAGISQGQNILIVDNDPTVDTTPAHMFDTWASAIAAANNGDIIYVQPSVTSYGNIIIDKEVTVYGSGWDPILNNGRNSRIGNALINANNVKLSGFLVDSFVRGATPTSQMSGLIVEDNKIDIGISFGTGSETANNVIIRGNVIGRSIQMHSNPTQSSNTVITNNFINVGVFGASSEGIVNANATTIFNNNIVVNRRTNSVFTIFKTMRGDVTAFNNIYISSGTQGMFSSSNGHVLEINNSISWKPTGVPLSQLMPGMNNFDNVDPQFVNDNAGLTLDASTDYSLTPNSPGAIAGSDGGDIGIFNGGYDFDYRGYPTELPYITSFTLDTNLITSGQNINANVKADANKS